VGWQVLDNITLYVAANDAHVVMAIDLQVEQGRFEPTDLELFDQHVEGNVDRKWINVTAENDTRNHTGTTCPTSGALACPRTFPGVKIRNFSSHDILQ